MGVSWDDEAYDTDERWHSAVTIELVHLGRGLEWSVAQIAAMRGRTASADVVRMRTQHSTQLQ